MNRKYVGTGACLNLNVSLLGIIVRCTIYGTIAMHCTLAYNSTTMAMTMTYGSVLMLMLIEYMKRYRIGFGPTGSTLVLVGACLKLNVSLLGVRCTMT